MVHFVAALAGAGTGGVIGGALGWVVGIGALAIPGVGPFIAAGPIMATLGGAAIGATAGGIAGGLIGMGIPELEAKRYEGKVKAGNILLSVHTENSEEITRAKDIFSEAGAEDIATTGEESTSKENRADNRTDDISLNDKRLNDRTINSRTVNDRTINDRTVHDTTHRPRDPVLTNTRV